MSVKTKLFRYDFSYGTIWVDIDNGGAVFKNISMQLNKTGEFSFFERDDQGVAVAQGYVTTPPVGSVYSFADTPMGRADTFDVSASVWTFAPGTSNRFITPDIAEYKDITQPHVKEITADKAVTDLTTGEPQLLSRLTSVISSDSTVRVSFPQAGQVDLKVEGGGVPDDLTVNSITTQSVTTAALKAESLNTSGNSTVDGNATVQGNAQVGGALTSKSLRADYAVFASYPSNRIPADLPPGAIFTVTAPVVTVTDPVTDAGKEGSAAA